MTDADRDMLNMKLRLYYNWGPLQIKDILNSSYHDNNIERGRVGILIRRFGEYVFNKCGSVDNIRMKRRRQRHAE